MEKSAEPDAILSFQNWPEGKRSQPALRVRCMGTRNLALKDSHREATSFPDSHPWNSCLL